MEEFVIDFTEDCEFTPIDIVSDITGLSYPEIRSIKMTFTTPNL